MAELSDWYYSPYNKRLVGIVRGHPVKKDGKLVTTSPVVEPAPFDPNMHRHAKTRTGTEYTLVGEPFDERRYGD